MSKQNKEKNYTALDLKGCKYAAFLGELPCAVTEADFEAESLNKKKTKLC